jgi:hypothetical protein
MFDNRGIVRGIDELGDIAEGLGSFTGSGRRSLRNAIEESVDDEVERSIVQRARANASPFVGEHASRINAQSGNWVGRQTYDHGLETDSEVVVAHEFGSGVHGGGSPYRISPEDDGVLAFEGEGGETVVVEYVVHPGVRGKHFLERTAKASAEDVADRIEREALLRLDDLL